MPKQITKKEVVTNIDANGNITQNEKETSFSIDTEEDYIKIYTKMWCEFNSIPLNLRELFLQLVTRMSYCNTENLESSQIVCINKIIYEPILKALKWEKNTLYKALKKLVEVGAIRKIARGVYQISPHYAGRGSWKYNPQQKRGGVKDLRAKFDFSNKKVETEIIWSDDGSDNEINDMYRQGLCVKPEDLTVLKSTSITNKEH